MFIDIKKALRKLHIKILIQSKLSIIYQYSNFFEKIYLSLFYDTLRKLSFQKTYYSSFINFIYYT